ncbi:MAG: O-antigen ligase family protein [Cyanobacteria bacterium]|nr:O-antigen ligase family protein [Cyanobacteriota bacterium]
MKQKYIDYGEIGFICLGVLFFSGGLSKLFSGSIVSLSRWFLFAGSISFILLRLNFLAYKIKRDIWLAGLIALAIFSFMWSDFSDFTFSSIKSEFMPMTAFGIYLGTSFDIRHLNGKICWGLSLGLLISILFAIANPSIGRDHGAFAGAWTGIYGHKNTTSSYMVLSALSLLLPSFRVTKEKWMGLNQHIYLRLLGFSALGFVFMTTSGTGLILSILISSGVFLYSKFRWKGKITVLLLDLVLLVFGSGAIILLGNWQEIVLAMGKDPTLTGRVPMWSIAIQRILERPLLGYGLRGFWAPGSPYPFELGRALDFTGDFIPPHVHNGLIDLALDVGLIGAGLFLASLIVMLTRAFQQAYDFQEPEDLWPLGFMILFVVNNITESYVFYRVHLFWPIYIAIALNVGRSKVVRSKKKDSGNMLASTSEAT